MPHIKMLRTHSHLLFKVVGYDRHCFDIKVIIVGDHAYIEGVTTHIADRV